MTDDERPRPFRELPLLEVECSERLENFVRKRLHDDPDTIKVVDQCWRELTETWHARGQLTNPRALLFKIAQHRMDDRFRQLSRRAEYPVGDLSVLEDTAAALSESEFVSSLVSRIDVGAAIAELPVRQRQVLKYVYAYGLAHKDAAALMGDSLHATDYLLQVARASLRKSRHLAGYRIAAPSSPPEVQK